MKEVKLPRAKETHELCYEPLTRCLFISQMSNSVCSRAATRPHCAISCSGRKLPLRRLRAVNLRTCAAQVLVRIPVDPSDGLLADGRLTIG